MSNNFRNFEINIYEDLILVSISDRGRLNSLYLCWYLLYPCITVILYPFISVSQFPCIIVSLYPWARITLDIPLYYLILSYPCIFPLSLSLDPCIPVSFCHCIPESLYPCILVSLHPCITVSLYLCILYPCVTASLYHCILVFLYPVSLCHCIPVSLYPCILVSLHPYIPFFLFNYDKANSYLNQMGIDPGFETFENFFYISCSSFSSCSYIFQSYFG